MTEASLKKKISSAGRRARVSTLRMLEIFSEKMTLKTSYYSQFGEPPKATEDFVVLK